MLVKDICTHEVVVVTDGTTVADAALHMRARHVGSLVVVSEGRTPAKPIGMTTDRDLAIAVLTRSDSNAVELFVGDVREQQQVVTVDANADVKSALAAMEKAGVRRAPVLERGAIAGVLSVDDVVFALADELSAVARLVRRQRSVERVRTGDDTSRSARVARRARRHAAVGNEDVDGSDAEGTASLLALEPFSDAEMSELTATPLDETEEREALLKVLAHETDVSLGEDPADAGAMVSALDQTLAVRTKGRHR